MCIRDRLYLIRKQNFDILDIPMAQVTVQYLAYVDEIPRSATGKANYPAAKELAEGTLKEAAADAN